MNDIGSITRKINGGTNGLADRKQWFERVWKLIEKEDDSVEIIKTIKPSPDIKWVQESLNELGVANPELNVDGKSGKKTEEAIKKYQKLNRLPVDGDAGPVTIESIKQSLEARKNDSVPQEKSLSKSTIVGGSVVGTTTAAVQLISQTKDVSDQLNGIKENLENVGILDLLSKLALNPIVITSVVLIIVFVFIIYKRWIMNREKGV